MFETIRVLFLLLLLYVEMVLYIFIKYVTYALLVVMVL